LSDLVHSFGLSDGCATEFHDFHTCSI
jgi:hypothetical protein